MDLFASAPVLRDYQVDAIQQLDAAVAAGARAPLLVAPTGAGKTVIAGALIARADCSVLFVAPRRELIYQTSRALRSFGVAHGVILAGADHLHDPDASVHVASIDTLLARFRHGKLLDLPDFGLVIVDEAHLSVTQIRHDLLMRWPAALRIGLTATPIRKDGRALGLLYDRIIEPVTTAGLIDSGYLVPARYFSISEPDLRRVRTTAGDWNLRDLDERVNRTELVADIVQTWLSRGAVRRTVVFCTSIPHSIAIAESFQRAGVVADHVSADTPTAERDLTMQRFTSGETQVLTNCFLTAYGFDLPELSCVVLARPTKSLMLYMQMIGRGLRLAPNKEDCLILDHSGCVHRHGFAHDARYWTLDGHDRMGDRKGNTLDRGEPTLIDCPECHAVFSGTRTCPECGHHLQPAGKDVRTLDGELVELDGTVEDIDRRSFYLQLRAYGVERGYSHKWAACQYRNRFGAWPPRSWNSFQPIEPSIAARRWIKSRMIAYAKARQRDAARATA
jgi:DNA repair protein RadD